MVVYRVQVKDSRQLHELILKTFGSVKSLSEKSGMSESTLRRIIKTKRLSYYAANRLGQALNINFSECFEIINIKE